MNRKLTVLTVGAIYSLFVLLFLHVYDKKVLSEKNSVLLFIVVAGVTLIIWAATRPPRFIADSVVASTVIASMVSITLMFLGDITTLILLVAALNYALLALLFFWPSTSRTMPPTPEVDTEQSQADTDISEHQLEDEGSASDYEVKPGISLFDAPSPA